MNSSNLLDISRLSASLEQTVGLTPEVAELKNGVSTVWRFVEFPRPLGFYIEAKYELGVARATLRLDKLAATLVEEINNFASVNWIAVQSTLSGLDSDQLAVTLLNKGKPIGGSLEVLDGTFGIQGMYPSQDQNAAFEDLLSLLIGLFGLLAGNQLEPDEFEFRREGDSKTVLANVYERSRFNRKVAIKIHGLVCFGCDFNFESFYGPIGRGVVEVHHTLPVHLMSHSRVVDPRSELVPLCSNCHTMIHKVDPPYTVAELRGFIQREPHAVDG
jgi:5-methylcytosine-specific restriction protein A